MTGHRVVLFDLFDTLCRVDESVYLEGKRREAALLGAETGAFVRAWVEAGDLAQIGLLAGVPERVRHAARSLRLPPPDDALVERVASVETATLAAATSLHSDAQPALEALRAAPGLRLGLVSNATSAAEGLACGPLGLERFFEAFTWSFRVGAAKPDPAIYRAACGRFSVPPEACVFVGDGNARELDGAQALGMFAVRVERPVSASVYRKEPSVSFDASIADLGRLPALLGL